MLTGYLHPNYAISLHEFGTPLELPLSGGWVLQRLIPGNIDQDAMGCYPFFCCCNWSHLASDLDQLTNLVSLTLITDPFGAYTENDLQLAFPDLVHPFKHHYVVDLHHPFKTTSKHHLRNIKKSLHKVNVETCTSALPYLDDWTALYQTLIHRHNIHGITAFSRTVFSIQFQIPGLLIFRAFIANKTVGMLLFYQQGETIYYHLGAYSPEGYQCNASFALFHHALEYCASLGNLHWLSLGAGAGLEENLANGLTRFKHGWTNQTRLVYLCGRIYQPERYASLTIAQNLQTISYFPAYRLGEFD
ncbi:MAG: GNAT family N-acetyltransferase [Anaerolineales bacterium]|nr:GNAT family N-acetyltransferase [Anaerolineales bacterium]